MIVLSFYDTTGLMLRPWAEAGFECHAFDIQNDEEVDECGIHKHHADLFCSDTLSSIKSRFPPQQIIAAFAFPPCTDLSLAGARWWARKAAANPNFQVEASKRISDLSDWLLDFLDTDNSFYLIENPKSSKLNSLWRKYDFVFNPNDFGGYLDEEEKSHPLWPGMIPDHDAYAKPTGLWARGPFVFPPKMTVDAERVKFPNQNRYHSPITACRSAKVRSATPRGFAKAVFLANRP